ncbi:hypothetical protein EMPS_11339 [Entomortierella parvispora]|uniref:Pentacotripeptide-repeat region of PRORP domain-containing protein n=1 Tax=Entomortierella parvispora TaxID=205924 RepID=A0A9P3HLV6_9FUNG|nr:hypothetical protein EMPS_11339 [Entomortierella parvispora]
MQRHCQALFRTGLRASRSSRQCPCPNTNSHWTLGSSSPLSSSQTLPARSIGRSPRFSTSALTQAIRTMTFEDLDEDPTPTKNKTKKPASSSSIRKSSSTPSSINTDPASTPETSSTSSSSTSSSEIEYDPQIYGPDYPNNAPEPIRKWRDQYEALRSSPQPSNLQEQEQLLAGYRKLADDPVTLAQLQPVDFMIALNALRDHYRVIPKMRRILADVAKTRHSKVPEIYHVLLKAYFKLSDFRSCGNLLESMQKDEIPYVGTTYHIMLDVCKHESHLQKARSLLQEMREKKIAPTSATYLLMISICGRAKKPYLAREYFEEMPLFELDRDITHYNALLNAYTLAKDLAGAHKVFEEMEEDGIQPDQYTYSSLVKVLKSNRRHHEAQKLVQDMEEKGIKANVQILSALGMNPEEILEKYIQDRQDKDHKGQKKDIVRQDYRGQKKGNKLPSQEMAEISRHDFNMLIIRSIRLNRFSQTPLLMEEMARQGHRPDMFTFTAMIDANIKMNKYPEAKAIFNAMKSANIQPDVIAYSALIAGALSQVSVHESMEILKTMVVNDGLLPNRHTFNSLLSASVGEVDVNAFKVIRKTMDALRIRPDQRSFNALLAAYALKGDLDEMIQTFDDMTYSRVPPDALSYSILISGYLQNGDLRYSMEWYYKMMERGFVPAAFLINNLMAALHGSGQGEQVLVLWNEMSRMDIRKNEQSYEIVLETCEKYGLDDARKQIEWDFQHFLARQSLPNHSKDLN